MGLIQHDAIIVTSWNDKHIQEAHDKAIELCRGVDSLGCAFRLPVTEIVESPVNDSATFLIAPDGSKEGWAESDLGNALRNMWLDWVKNSGLYLDVVTVNYGELNDETTPVRAEKVL